MILQKTYYPVSGSWGIMRNKSSACLDQRGHPA
jgi:hypothetical protein